MQSALMKDVAVSHLSSMIIKQHQYRLLLSFLLHYSLHFALGIAKRYYVHHACLFVCVCLSAPCRIPTLLHGPGSNFGEWQECPLIVHCCSWCTGFIAMATYVPNVKCQRGWMYSLCGSLLFCAACNLIFFCLYLQCFDAVGRVSGRASGPYKSD